MPSCKQRDGSRRHNCAFQPFQSFKPFQPLNTPSRLLKKSLLQAAQKDPEARRAKNRRAEAYIGSTLTRGD